MKTFLSAAVSVALLSVASPGIADEVRDADIPYQCEDSVVTKTGYYFENQPDSGSYVVFKSNLGVKQIKDATVSVVDRNAPPTSVLAKQKVGDRVQVCLVGYPTKDQSCNPDRDPRGRYYRVYNYRQKAAYQGTNGNHLCGGA
ncbi:hypothetical protein [Phormidesmis priestleyi]